MRTLILMGLALCAAVHGQVTSPSSGLAQLPMNTNGLTIDAQLVSNGGAMKTDHRPSAPGSSQQLYETAKSTETRASKYVVELRARNMGTMPAETHVDWFFYARDLQSKSQYIWDRGQRDFALAPGSEQKEMLQSTELYQSTVKRSSSIPQTNNMGQTTGYLATGTTQQSGARPYGWVVRIWSGDKLLQVRASSNDLEKLARDLGQLPKF